MKQFLKAAVAVAVLTGSVGLGHAAATVLAQQEQIITFYGSEDESTTNIVGQTVVYCDGSITHTGSYSMYSSVQYFTCD